jgi:hypothetical protein
VRPHGNRFDGLFNFSTQPGVPYCPRASHVFVVPGLPPLHKGNFLARLDDVLREPHFRILAVPELDLGLVHRSLVIGIMCATKSASVSPVYPGALIFFIIFAALFSKAWVDAGRGPPACAGVSIFPADMLICPFAMALACCARASSAMHDNTIPTWMKRTVSKRLAFI